MRIKFKNIGLPGIVIMLMFLSGFLEGVMGISSVVYFLIDIPIIIMLIKKRKTLSIKRLKYYDMSAIEIFSVLIFLIQFIYAIVTLKFSINTIYGFYRLFRVLLFYLSCVSYLKTTNIAQMIHLFKILFIVNAILIVFQFLILNVDQDLLNGIFGIRVGGNAYTNLFFVIISVFLFSKYFFGILSFKQIAPGIGMILLLTALSEIKFFFFEALIIVVLCFLQKVKNPKNIIKAVLMICATFVFYQFLVSRYSEFANLASDLIKGGVARLIDLQRHYSTDYDIGRAVFMNQINSNYFTEWYHYLFGLGIGNCSSSAFVNNSFYILNQASHYDQFQTAYTYIEQGLVGFILYLSILICPIIIGVKKILQNKKNVYTCMLILFGVMGVFIFYYNMALFSQYSFMYFWALASTFYLEKNTVTMKNGAQ